MKAHCQRLNQSAFHRAYIIRQFKTKTSFMSVSKVYVIDIMEKRLQKALELGADGIINGAQADVVEEVRKLCLLSLPCLPQQPLSPSDRYDDNGTQF